MIYIPRQVFSSLQSRHRLLTLLGILFLALMIPVVEFTLQKQQETRQRAATITPSPGIQDTFAQVNIVLSGIGTTGNNVPLHQTKVITVSLYNTNTHGVIINSDSVVFANGVFINQQFKLGKIPSGTYQIFFKSNGYLQKKVVGNGTDTFSLTSGSTISLPQTTLIAGDIAPVSGDNVLDISDYNMLFACFGPRQNSSSCTNVSADLDDNGSVNGADYNLLIRNIATIPVGDTIPNQQPLLTPAVTTPFSNANKLFGVNIAGADFKLPVYPGTSYSGYAYYHGKGLTLIRLPFTWEKMQTSLNGPLGGDIAKLTDMITTAQNAGEKVFIEPHNYARFNGIPLTTADAPALQNFWKQLAAKYATGFPGLWGYEIMNEPHDLSGGCTTWQTLAQAAVTGIRQSDTTHVILVPGYSWQSAERWPSQSGCLSGVHDPSNNMIFSAHEYFDVDASGTHFSSCPDPNIGVQRLQPFFTWLSQNNAKGILTEFGAAAGSCWLTTLDNFMNALNNNSNIVGATYWSGGPFWGGYPMSVEPSGGQDKPQMSILQKYPSR